MAFSQSFEFTGSVQTLVLDPGVYRYEVYGAQGGGGTGGAGGRSFGNHTIFDESTLYIYVGGRNGWNGGGAAGRVTGESDYLNGGTNGGGGSDIRFNGQTLDDRIIVAGGGGGGSRDCYGGAGGGLTGGNGINNGTVMGAGATQTSGYAKGQGQQGRSETSYDSNGSGGGGGYWGGRAGTSGGQSPGGGGSGYIDPILTNASTQQGGRSGNGFIKVSIVGYIPYKAVLVNNNIICENIISGTNEGLTVNKITVIIDEIETTVIEDPESNPTLSIDMNVLTFGLHNMSVLVNYTDPDGVEGSFTYTFKFVKYGEGMPSNVPMSDIPIYIEAIKTQIVDIKRNLKEILVANGFVIEDNIKLTNMIDVVSSMSNNNNATVTEYINQISNLQNQVDQLNKELASKVTPAGDAVAEDVVSGKTFINSTGQLVTGSYIKPPDTAVLYPGTVSLFNLSASNIRPRDYHDGDGDFTRPLKVTCSTSIPKSGWYKIDLTMYESKDFPVEYRIITYTYVNNASKVINLVGKTASNYNGYYCNFTRSFYLYLMAGLPLELQIQGHSVFTSSEYGRLSYTIKCDYTG